MVVQRHDESEEALAEEASLPQGVVVPGSKSSESPAMVEAASRGMKKPASCQSASSVVVQRDTEGAGDMPPLSVISTFVAWEPQVITLHLGGQWGLGVSQCSVNL